MEIRTLKYFLAVAREQNMTEAANVLFVTQPTLSRQMADLEKELGKKLFVRTNRSTTLTEEGMHLRQRAEEILALRLLSIHNLHFLLKFAEDMRTAIANDTFPEFRAAFLENYETTRR